MATLYNLFNKKTIEIPLIQRDYVQAEYHHVIAGLIDNIIDVLKSTERKTIDLNYIYGYYQQGEDRFIPVDGQQRITTLWLLHLYLYARSDSKEPFSIFLKYASREYANDFCRELKKNIEPGFFSEQEFPSVTISRQPWYIDIWKDDASVSAMIKALDEVHSHTLGIDIKDFYLKLTTQEIVNFAHKDTKELGDDIYVKMNARGRELSDFENLKSWMDGRLLEIGDETFLSEWRTKIDNDWTELFWNNRNLNETNPEEIDDEQMRFFYNMLVLFWSKSSTPEAMLNAEQLKDGKQKEYFSEICRVLNIKEADTSKEITSAILEYIRQSDRFSIPLYLLDKLALFPKKWFKWTASVLDGLCRCEAAVNVLPDGDKSIGQEAIYFWDKPETDKPITFICQLLFEETVNKSVPYNKLLLCYALCAYVSKEDSFTPIFDWMYHLRNLILNTQVDNSNFGILLNDIDKLLENCLTADINTLTFEGTKFDKTQCAEERVKNSWICSVEKQDIVNTMRRLENHPFFSGKIKFMIDFLGNNPKPADFHKYASLMARIFSKNSFAEDIDHISIRKALMAFSTFYSFGYERNGNWNFLSSKEDKRMFVSDSDVYEGSPHNHCLHRLLMSVIEAFPDISDFSNVSGGSINSVLEQASEQEFSNITDWRKPFKKNKLWRYISGGNNLKWCSVSNIYLLTKQRKSASHVNLHTYLLWIDNKTILNERLSSEWNVALYQYEGSCIYIERKNGDYTFAIDLYHDDRAEDSYFIAMLVRHHPLQTQQYLQPLADRLCFEYSDGKQRFILKESLPSKEAFDMMVEIAKGINTINLL